MSQVKRRNKNTSVSSINSNSEAENETTIKKVKDNLAREKPLQNQSIPLKVLSRIVVIFSLLTIVYFSSKNEKVVSFAKQSEVLPGRGQIVECSPDLLQELNKYEGCLPQNCGRFVTDNVVSANEAHKLLEIAKKGFSLSMSSGGASILDLHTGALSQGQHFVNLYKLKEAKNIFTNEDFSLYKLVKENVRHAISQSFGVDPNKIYLTHPTFFSQITSKKAVTLHDEYWHPHVDKETYKSFHYTTLVYLNDYNVDFKGGSFVFIDEKVNRTVEPRKGRLSMFTSGSENLHYVEKVTSGVRNAITISFTCDKQYAIEDPSRSKYD